MPEFPLLPLPALEIQDPPPGKPFPPPPGPRHPTRARQAERLGPIFDRLAAVVSEDRDPVELRDDPASLAPERVIVFEVAGSIGDFAAACRKVPGLEYFTERETEFEPDDDFWVVDTRRHKEGERRDDQAVGGRLYAAMPDVRALRELLSLWTRHQQGSEAEYGFKPWFNLFDHLHGLRPWGPEDRIPDEAREDFLFDLKSHSESTVALEVELWYRGSEQRRERARQDLADVVAQAGGSIVHQSSIPPVGYEAALVRLPRDELERLIDREPVHLVVCDDVMFVRPQCSTFPQPADRRALAGLEPEGPLPEQDKPPVVGLLDGVPVQKHQLLEGRVVIDDPHGLDEQSLVSARYHGTAMASLIIHGDRNQGEAPLNRRIHVHPVMYAPDNGSDERFQPDRLLIDTIYRAVLRMKEGFEGVPPSAPNVFLVNLSLGDPRRPYAGWISPWARLLDYLAHTYGILFIVSAGNITQPLPISRFDTMTAFEDAEESEREDAILEGLGQQRSQRTLLSPSEALNVLTVGASHDDAVNDSPGSTATGANVIAYVSRALPNVSSAMGLGHRKVIKPDILMPGGRESVFPISGGDQLQVKPGIPGARFGIRAAAPDPAGTLTKETHTGRTSAAAALATRAAHQLHDALIDPENGSVLADADPADCAVVIRALLVHAAQWDELAASKLGSLYGPQGRGKHVERLDNVTRLLGYGIPQVADVMTCTPHRATMVGYGRIKSNEMAVCRLPLPPSLVGVTVPRTLMVTLAWFSPVNVRHLAYRMARLDVTGGFDVEFGTSREKSQPSHVSIPRGTLFHQRYHGEETVQFVGDGEVALQITCKEPAGPLDETIRYGLAVTIEAGEGIPVYDEVRQALAVRVRG